MTTIQAIKALRDFLRDGEAPCSCAGTVDGDPSCAYCTGKDEANAAVEHLDEVLASAQHEVAEIDAVLRIEVAELMDRLSSSCVWCGEECPKTMSPSELSGRIREHVLTCRGHPMRGLEAERDIALLSAEHGGKEWMELQAALGFPDDGMERGVRVISDSAARLKERTEDATRSACWEAVQRVAATLGLGPTEREMLRTSIEGAAP